MTWLVAGLLVSAATATALPARTAAAGDITGPILRPAVPVVTTLPPAPARTPITVDGRVGDWHGSLSHLAGTAHYDRGEWIYEDYPWTATGAAAFGFGAVLGLLGSLGAKVPALQRVPGAVAYVAGQAGAGPMVDDADLSQFRVTVRGPDLYVLARTTTMRAPARTALLLLVDTGRAGPTRTVPFGSGLHTSAADTAILVTAAGSRTVDLVNGRVVAGPAAADPAGYVNALEARLPLASIAPPGATELRFVAATGVVNPGLFDLVPSGQAGPIAKVVPRFAEPAQSVYDRSQALALANHDIDGFTTAVSLTRLRRGDSQRLAPGIGYQVRTFDDPTSISTEGGTQGILQQYGLYLPKGYVGRPTPATVMLHGSGFTANSHAAIDPGLFRQLGDDNGAIVISPGGHDPNSLFEGAGYVDVNHTISDAEALLPIDPDRLTVAGYSMGGYGTYLFAATQPDRFAAAFVIAGPVGGRELVTWAGGIPDVIPSLANLSAIPLEIYQGDVDVDVPLPNGLAAAARLQALGLRYRLDIFLGTTHLTPGIVDAFTVGAKALRGAQRDTMPSEVRFSRVMPYERAVDLGVGSSDPTAGRSMGLRFDHAWFVSDLTPVDPTNGTATVDARTLARPRRDVRPIRSYGLRLGGGELPSLVDEQRWQADPVAASPRNAMELQLNGTSSLTLDLAGMGLTTARPLTADITADTNTTVRFAVPTAACAALTVDGHQLGDVEGPLVALRLAAGHHTASLTPCRAVSREGVPRP